MRDWSGLIVELEGQFEWPDLAIAFAIGGAVFSVLWLARLLVRRHHRALAATARYEVLEIPTLVASRTATVFMLLAALTAGAESLDLPRSFAGTIRSVMMVAFFWQGGLWGSAAAMAWLDQRSRAGMQAGKSIAGSIGILRFVARALIWSMVVLMVLDNLGTDVTALVAGLGIGGIAVALALQNVLGDLLASLTIALDQPFVVGDFLVVGEHMGTVEYIGIKSTRLRSLGGEQIVMPNSDLLASPVRNYGRMAERRVSFWLDIAYETAGEKLKQVPPLVRQAIEAQQGIRFDRCHFAEFGESALRFEAVYYAMTPDFNRHMDIRQAINYAIGEAFERLGIGFAYPTRRIWLANFPVSAGNDPLSPARE